MVWLDGSGSRSLTRLHARCQLGQRASETWWGQRSPFHKYSPGSWPEVSGPCHAGPSTGLLTPGSPGADDDDDGGDGDDDDGERVREGEREGGGERDLTALYDQVSSHHPLCTILFIRSSHSREKDFTISGDPWGPSWRQPIIPCELLTDCANSSLQMLPQMCSLLWRRL